MVNTRVTADVAAVTDLMRAHARSKLLVVTGAGVSLASGVPTFRGQDPGAIWKADVTKLGTLSYFRKDPVGSWRWYLSRFDGTVGASPNPAHVALAALERWFERQNGDGDGEGDGQLLLITQNIDGLHRQAGSKNLVEVHGRADRVRCPGVSCSNGAPSGSLPRADFNLSAFRADPTDANLPRCPRCKKVMRQHVLWFDETYDSHDDYQWDRVQEGALGADAVLFIGTSFSVGVTALILEAALDRGRPVVSIDPAGAAPDSDVIQIRARAEELLPAVCENLGATFT